jgi:hypothetical protein
MLLPILNFCLFSGHGKIIALEVIKLDAGLFRLAPGGLRCC